MRGPTFGLLGFLTATAACVKPPDPVVLYPALAADCSPTRIGRVTVDGATIDDIAPLAVLEGTLDDPERAARITAVATELLQAHGYPYAHIDVARRVDCGTELHVAVARGPRYHIAALAFATSDEFPADERELAVEDALGTVNAVGGAYLEARMKRALAGLEHRYHEAGWIDARIDAPEARFDARTRTVNVVVPIHAGPRYRIGRVVASGAGGVAVHDAVIDALGLRDGEWYNAPRLRVGISRARRTTDRAVELRFEVAQDRKIVDLEARIR